MKSKASRGGRGFIAGALALVSIAMLSGAPPANAGVNVGIGVGVPVAPPAVAAPPVVAAPVVPYAPPPVVVGAPAVSVGAGFGHRPWHGHDWHHHWHR
ncbi:MAG TPA: hypothetical protein VGB82_02175 [Alphaproteobacteria bacterium]